MSEAALLEQLRVAKEKIKEQQEFIEQVSAPPFMIGIIVNVQGKETVVAGKNGTMVVVTPKPELPVGKTVILHPQSSQIIKSFNLPVFGGEVPVRRVLEDGRLEVGMEQGSSVVLRSPEIKKVEPGDTVILDEMRIMAMTVIPSEKKPFVVEPTGVCWNDIGGLEYAKSTMIEAIEWPYKHAELFRYYGKSAPKGILLWGPPGCGKTMLGKAASTAISGIHKATGGEGFLYVKTPELLSPWVGEAEAAIRKVFKRAAVHKEKTNVPAVIFFDEADALMNKRGSGISTDIDRTIVPTFLTEMDGVESSGALVIIATNRADTLDEAIVRDGRVDRKIEVPRPNQDETKNILGIHLAKVPVDGARRDRLSNVVADKLFTDHAKLMDKVLSGAFLAGIVDRSTSLALGRDRKSNRRTGVSEGDLMLAVQTACDEAVVTVR